MGEGSNVIQIAGNLSQNQLGLRARDTAGSSITGLCAGIGDRTFLNNRPARGCQREKVRVEHFSAGRAFDGILHRFVPMLLRCASADCLTPGSLAPRSVERSSCSCYSGWDRRSKLSSGKFNLPQLRMLPIRRFFAKFRASSRSSTRGEHTTEVPNGNAY